MKNNASHFSRRNFIASTATVAAGLSLGGSKVWGAPAYIPHLLEPNSKINGVQLGTITYSFRSLKDQSAEATLQYVLDCGISAVELMGDPAETFAGKPENPVDRRKYYGLMRAERDGKLTADQEKEFNELKAQGEDYEKQLERWDKQASLSKMETLRKMYNAAGVSIYAYKPDRFLRKGNSDENINFAMQAGKILGASHVTIELPREADYTLKLGKMAEQNGILVAYHGHEQQHPEWWDVALEQSPNNAMNMDLGHFVAAGNLEPLQTIQQKHQWIKSMHVKDRRNPANGKSNLPFGQGDTPIIEALQLMRNQKYTFPATIEYEYETPEGSDVISEIKKCVAYCKNALES